MPNPTSFKALSATELEEEQEAMSKREAQKPKRLNSLVFIYKCFMPLFESTKRKDRFDCKRSRVLS